MAEQVDSLLRAGQIAAMAEKRMQHRFNANGVRMTRSLGDACGMTQLGVHLVRVQPGCESTEYHVHRHDEEWIYILSGRATAEIGGRRTRVEAGDFMGFAAGSEPHTMTNDAAEDLVYLVGGTRHAYDVVDYPRRGIRSFKYAGERDNVYTDKLGAE